MIIIPDVHGRTFWKDAVKDREDELIVFLGDYTDPYKHEKINNDECLNNFKEILDFKKEHKDNVILLLGNHDFGYFNRNMISCRHDYNNHDEYNKLFTDNKDLFQLAYSKRIGDTTYLFTHAGIMKEWWDYVLKNPQENPDEVLNKMYQDDDNKLYLYNSLYCVDRWRGGIQHFGSCIWADIRSYDDKKQIFPKTYQIVGHTQLNDKPYIGQTIACLDCRRGFELTNNGEIVEMDKK